MKGQWLMKNSIHIPQELPLLAVRNTVVFPYMLLSLYAGREISKKAIETALRKNRIIFLTAQKNPEEEDITEQSVFKTGSVGMILRHKKLKDGRIKLLVQGLSRGVIQSMNCSSYHSVRIQEVQDLETNNISEKTQTLIKKVKTTLKAITSFGGPASSDLLMILDEINSPGRLADLTAAHFEFKSQEMQNILEIFEPEKRLEYLQNLLNKEAEIIKMQSRIKKMLKNNLSQFPKYTAPPQDAKTEEMAELLQKIKTADLPKTVEQEALKQASRLEKMHSESSEASMVRNYLDWVVELPWNKSTTDNLDMNRAKDILEKDHFSLHEVKERILEFLAVRKLKKDGAVKGPILCFAGPPGVGKTSLGKSIAQAMERKYSRVALGGIKDEAEIRGHRRTYVGAMPGKIIQSLKQVQSNNPILVLDEVDKLGSDYRGDPNAALLEVLDPEQNSSFKDNYLNLNFDLSRVLFIATANNIENIPPALRDRMEIIRLSGYTLKEKKEITKKYIIDKQIKEHGMNKNNISFNEKSIEHLIVNYTREAGLRNLNREIGSLCRKAAKLMVTGKAKRLSLTPKKITELLGPVRFLKEDLLTESKVGVSTGLAWTESGGDILYVEAIAVPNESSSGSVSINASATGQLGKVMQESVRVAFSYIRKYADKIGIEPNWFKENEIHIHLPAGAIPKDGPSAGTALASALISLVTNTPIRKDIAMTGEIGLQGQVLPVGGIKEKALAALSQGVHNVILPLKNRVDIESQNKKDTTLKELREKINFIYVKDLDEVFSHALEKKPKQNLLREKFSASIAG